MIAWFATKGSGTNDALRMQQLLSGMPDVVELAFNKAAKQSSFLSLLAAVREKRPGLVVMEGTGIAGGLVCLLSRLLWRIPYVFSSGDAVGPFVASLYPILGPFFMIYEMLLCRMSAGFIGWTPYLCGRALTFGCPRAMTAPGWPIGSKEGVSPESRSVWRAKWRIPEGSLVIGLVGSLAWNANRNYCYGLDLISAVVRLQRDDIVVVVVGEGDGMKHLKEKAGKFLGSRIRLPGRVALDEVLNCTVAFDVGALPQSTDGVGAFRYTTKLSEYAAARLPVITSKIPVAYDIGADWMWRLPGRGPWDERYIAALAELMEKLHEGEISHKKSAIPPRLEIFTREAQIARVTMFVTDLVAENETDDLL